MGKLVPNGNIVGGVMEGAGKGIADEHERAWRAGEAEKQRKWQEGQNAADREWKSGESSKDRDWRSSERREGQEWQTEERESGQDWRSNERREGEDWQSSERQAGQDWQSSERQAGQEWQSGENRAGRDWQSSERQAGQEWRTGERQAGQEWQSGENELDREWQRWNAEENRKWQTGRDTKEHDFQMGMQGNMFEQQDKQLASRQKHDVKMKLLDATLRGYMTPGASYGANATAGLGSASRVPHPAQQAQEDLYSHRSVGLQTDAGVSIGTQTLSGGMNRRATGPQIQPGPPLKKAKTGVVAPVTTRAATGNAIKPASHVTSPASLNSGPSGTDITPPKRDKGFSGTTGKGPEDRLAEGMAGGPEGLLAAGAEQFNEDTGRIGYGVGRIASSFFK